MKRVSSSLRSTSDEALYQSITATKLLSEKTRINLYLPKAIVELLDSFSHHTSRGEVVTQLLIKEVKQKKQPQRVYGNSSDFRTRYSSNEAES